MFPEYFLLLLFTECFIFHCRFLKFSYVDFESQASRPKAPLRLSINNTCKKLVSFIAIINISLHPYILAKKFNKMVKSGLIDLCRHIFKLISEIDKMLITIVHILKTLS